MQTNDVAHWALNLTERCEAYAHAGFGGFYLHLEFGGRAEPYLVLEWLEQTEVGRLAMADVPMPRVHAAIAMAAQIIRENARVDVFCLSSEWMTAIRLAGLDEV